MRKALLKAWFGGAMVVATWASSGCNAVSKNEDGDSNDSNDSNDYCARAVTKFRSCGMDPFARELDEECNAPNDDVERCYFECAIRAPCDEVRESVCSGALAPGVAACYAGCEPPPFVCGSGESLPQDFTCDGFPDCSDGSDERANCPTCANGATIPDYSFCDGFPDCADGSDETRCPTFRCNNGATVPEAAECDFFVDCADGSDEHAACPDIFTCDNGDRVPDYFECDDYPDCIDGSDEHAGCPRVTCADGTTVSGERCDDNEDCFDGSDEPANCPPSARDQVCGTQ